MTPVIDKDEKLIPSNMLVYMKRQNIDLVFIEISVYFFLSNLHQINGKCSRYFVC
jgi:hypothetical protein